MLTFREYLSDPTFGLVREVRQPQLRMAENVAKTIDEGGVYVAEGPVGSGKTFAYLLPAILAGKRIVVSTPKKSLQDQIMKKDLPAIMKALGKTQIDVGCIGVKGKGNYTCKRKAEAFLPSDEYLRWQSRSPYGDRADYPGPTPSWWGEATAESCVGMACTLRNTCGYIRLRQELGQEVPVCKVIVINHHLLGLDFYYGVGNLVGGAYDVLIIDEAHKLVDGVREAFTLRVSEHSAHDITKLIQDTGLYVAATNDLGWVWEQLFQSVPNKHWKDPHERRAPIFAHDAARDTVEHLTHLHEELTSLLNVDEDGEVQYPPEIAVPLDQARRKTQALILGIRTMQGSPYRAGEEEDPETVQMRNEQYMRNTVIYAQGESRPGRFSVYAAPVHTGSIVSMGLKQIPATVMVSATLAVNGKFKHLAPIIGVEPTLTDILPPAFDYAKQGILYVPKHLPYRARPQKNDEEAAELYDGYLEALTGECAFLVQQSGGNAFILTTANDEMEQITDRLRARSLGLPIFMQEFRRRDGTRIGDGSPEAILRKFMTTDGSVLVGSKAFWEGVDVQGEKLSLVIIPKLPFPTRSNPIIDARRRATEDAFKNVDLVDMITDLRQGAGRLIRSATDRGVVALLDTRIWDRKSGRDGVPARYSSYGKQIVDALPFPPNVITHERKHVAWYLPRVKRYFEKLRADAQRD